MINDNTIDDHVDEEVYKCLNLEAPQSFFLFAGAGSGKTRTLVNVLKKIKKNHAAQLRRGKQKVAVITYTNNACDEIKLRLGNDLIFKISTIHSFIWELIKFYSYDIREWLRISLSNDIIDLEEKQLKGRAGTKASIDRERQIKSKSERLSSLDEIRQFTYNPNGDNLTKQSLNHNQVISIGAYFLKDKALMQQIMVRNYPILLIDESQDTIKELINAFFEVQNKCSKVFSLGLIGDTMQQIYTSGKENLGKDLPEDWATPSKIMNHRSDKRIVHLINEIRKEVDSHVQRPRTDKNEGLVRLYLVVNKTSEKLEIESIISKEMASLTKDELWFGQGAEFEVLTIEHHMVARRYGFLGLFEPLYKVNSLKTGLLDGTLSQLRLFTEYVLPLINAKKEGDEFLVSQIVRKNSPLLKSEYLKKETNQRKILKKVNESVIGLFKLWDNENDPSIIDVLKNINNSGLFSIHESLMPIALRDETEYLQEDSDDIADKTIDALDEAFTYAFSEVSAYKKYISGESTFETHQGVKGLEYPRVMVIIDDSEARGFMFNYNKLFGAKALTKTDEANISEGRETSIDRTRRLFYVACSRAKESLAIVIYTDNPQVIKSTVIEKKWFEKSEIRIIS